MNDQEWKRGEQDSMGLQCEYGCTGNVHFMDSSCAEMVDSSGNTVLCRCGKPAGSAAIGRETMIAWCEECSPLPKYEAGMVYKAPLKQDFDPILNPDWVVNLKPTEEQNGDIDWYCPDNILPRSGEPVYLKMQVTFKAWYTPDCKLSKWILENQHEADGKILAWQHRKGKNFQDRE